MNSVSEIQNINTGKLTSEMLSAPQKYSKVNSNGVDKTPTSDTVQLSSEQKQSKWSRYKKIILGAGAAILAGLGIYALSRGRNKNALKESGQKAGEILKEGEAKLKTGEQRIKTQSEIETEERIRKAEEELKEAKKRQEELIQQQKKAEEERIQAQKKAEAEARAKAEAEAKEKAEAEARAKAEKEAEELRKAEEEKQRRIEKQAKFERVTDMSTKYVEEHMKELDAILLDSEGKIAENPIIANSPKYSIDELFKPYKGDIAEFYHATTPEAKEKILKEGFNPRIAPTHGYLNGLGGTYFALNKKALADGGYGSTIVTAGFNGKIAEFNPNLVDSIKHGNTMTVYKKLVSEGMEPKEASDLAENILLHYFQQKLFAKGYQGVVTTEASYMAGCRYFSAIDPKLIKIIS